MFRLFEIFFRVKPAIFDLFLAAGIACYIGLFYLAIMVRLRQVLIFLYQSNSRQLIVLYSLESRNTVELAFYDHPSSVNRSHFGSYNALLESRRGRT